MTPLPDETYTINVLGQNSDGTHSLLRSDRDSAFTQGLKSMAMEPDYGGLVGGANNGTVEYVEVTGIVVPNADTSTGTTNAALNITGSGAAQFLHLLRQRYEFLHHWRGCYTTIHGTVGRDTIVGGTGNVTFLRAWVSVHSRRR